ncbi:PREDICTED: kunitz-type protease inhibitor 2-like isoform X1 [Nanorana parkeri]|uniref:kunitz-type protease inhibitor 2-like isoform X1 n=1 Tax=Nanorana parkeri TaxID=125878 RepID=UPI0008546287|nr:PREDICTED: kunitz-type protease inhibitor 2-like isoform X1 [Nanorana parkeri]
MAAWLRGFFLFLLPLALADTQLPCEGYEVVEGFGLENVEAPAAFGVKVVEVVENVESDKACWERCCGATSCDLAQLSKGKCHLVRCNVKGFNMCNLTAQEDTRSYRKVDAGVQPRQEDFCLTKGETGPCRAYFVKWWYDAETESCQNFTYGGCPVNLNNHEAEDECMEKCRGVKVTKAETNPAPERLVADISLPEMCSGSFVTGNCRAAFPRWYFDSQLKSCRKFIYGGCGASKNNHVSEEECINNCVAPKPEPAPVQSPKVGNFKDYCAAAPSTGSCRASFRRFFYDPTAMACKTFVYGGCKPNKNNYLTEDDCLKMCQGRSEEDDGNVDHHVIHRPLTAVVLPILLAVMAASLLGVMIVFFVKMAKKNQQSSDFRAMWNPIDDKECLMNNAYSL